MKPASPKAIRALDAAPRAKPSHYDLFGLKNFGVNLTRLAPGAQSALRHAHTRQDEFVYILEGHPTLVTDSGRRGSSQACAPGSARAAATRTTWRTARPPRFYIPTTTCRQY
jgi:uncharacterized cupin superfamily protein